MRTRDAGLDWLEKHGRATDEQVRVSKYYLEHESWPGTPVWWFEFPLSSATEDRFGFINLLCAVAPGSSEYHHLRIPFGIFLACQHHFWRREDGKTVSLYLSAEEPTLFREMRGSGGVEFGPFRLA